MFSEANELPDVVLDDQRRCWLAGEQPEVVQLLQRHGQDIHHDALLDLVYHEIMLKEELGIAATIEEYCERYPELANDLKLHFEVHQAVNQQFLLETATLEVDRLRPQQSSAVNSSNFPTHDYDVRQLIGQGGMAVVYQARQRRLQRDVALKLFEPGRILTSREASRIRIEAEAMARLAHPNIVQIFEIGEIDGSPFLALELASGGTLATRLSASPMTAAAAAELIEALSCAVQHAHERDVIHRDIKPANILFTQDGTPKITDFGLAKVLDRGDVGATDVTRTGEAMGTPRYMAPEQAAGEHDEIGPATDVYALGTVLYECLTGRAPFLSANVPETLYLIREADPVPPRRLQLSIPRDLETICLHCLEKDPSRRYLTAQELTDDLRRFRKHEPIRARPTTVFERGWKWCRKRPAHAALMALCTLLVSVGMFAATTAAHRERMRLDGLRREVVQLMKSGRASLDRDELEAAQSRFQEAWQIVRGEPKLSDYETSITGWLDHSRNALNRYHWKQRIPPRDFDHRRDEALLLSLLQFPEFDDQITVARKAIHEALELTLPDQIEWNQEREQLYLIDAQLVGRQTGLAAALLLLDGTNEFDSRAFHLERSHILEQLQRTDEARTARENAERHPQREVSRQFFDGMSRIRDRQFSQALSLLETILNKEPEHFAARLMQALCFLKLDRNPEATVGLTACIAQRPNFSWNFLLRGQARRANGESELAALDFQSAIMGRPSPVLKLAASRALEQSGPTATNEQNPPPSSKPWNAPLPTSVETNRLLQGQVP